MTTSSTVVTVVVTRGVSGNPVRVFDAWLDPAAVSWWMRPSKAEDALVSVQVDPRVGGSFSFVVRLGGEETDFRGEYLVVDRPYRLSFTWTASRPTSDPTTVTVEHHAMEDRTLVKLTHEGVPDAHAAVTEQGWKDVLDAIDAYLRAAPAGGTGMR